MGYNTTVTGTLHIVPPLSWTEFQDSKYCAKYDERTDLILRVDEESVPTPDGPLLRRTARALVPAWEEAFRAYRLLENVQAAIDAFPEHEFIGVLECEGEDNPDMWRIVVRGRQAVKVEPEIKWPEGTHPNEVNAVAAQLASLERTAS